MRPSIASMPEAFCTIVRIRPRPSAKSGVCSNAGGKGGEAKIMIYHKWSMVGVMLWIRYGLLRLRPFTSLKTIYACYLESLGTKAYSVAEARRLFEAFSEVRIRSVLTHSDLLTSEAGQRHRGTVVELGA